jgi:hypothetical protein
MYECVHPYQALAYPLDLRMLHRISANHAAKALEVLQCQRHPDHFRSHTASHSSHLPVGVGGDASHVGRIHASAQRAFAMQNSGWALPPCALAALPEQCRQRGCMRPCAYLCVATPLHFIEIRFFAAAQVLRSTGASVPTTSIVRPSALLATADVRVRVGYAPLWSQSLESLAWPYAFGVITPCRTRLYIGALPAVSGNNGSLQPIRLTQRGSALLRKVHFGQLR